MILTTFTYLHFNFARQSGGLRFEVLRQCWWLAVHVLILRIWWVRTE